jgi:hypothetical protein
VTKPTDRWVQVTARVETDEPFVQFAAAVLLNFLGKSTRANAVLMLCRTIREVYSTLLHIIKTALQLVCASAVHRTHPADCHPRERLPQVRRPHMESHAAGRTRNRAMPAGECRHAWRCLNLGVAYYKHGIEENYSAEVLARLQAVAGLLEISDLVPS